MTVSPNPAPERTDIVIEIGGEGFGDFLLTVGADPPIGSFEPALIFTANDRECRKLSGNISVFKEFACGITNQTAQTWLASITRQNNFAPGDYSATLETGGQPLANTAFRVGNPQPPSSPLTVTINPPGPLNNDQDHEVTISWSPALPGSNYTVDSSLLYHALIPCTNSPCSTTMVIPRGVTAGAQRVTVTRDGDSSNTGFTTIQIEAVIEPGVTDFPRPTIIRNKLINCEKIASGSADYEAALAECQACVGNPNNPEGIPSALGCIKTARGALAGKVFGILLGIAGGIALLLIIFSGYRMIAAAGNPEALQGARETLTSAIVGLLFIIFSFVILELIGVDILRVPGFGGTPAVSQQCEQPADLAYVLDHVGVCGGVSNARATCQTLFQNARDLGWDNITPRQRDLITLCSDKGYLNENVIPGFPD